MDEDNKLLAWFLGPKSENASVLEESILLILRDYFHWRRNYFSSDDLVISRQQQRVLEPQFDGMHQNLLELLAELRRNFPFYSPRYFAHMLSDTVLTSTIGYIAGMMYNPNNVTPEAAPVTVGLEIEACNTLLKMLGYLPPPELPAEIGENEVAIFKRKLQPLFGWGHLTHGGTTANLEALWVARNVKYTTLAIWDVAKQQHLDFEVKQPNGESHGIEHLTPKQLLSIKPNESIYLLAKFIDALRRKNGQSISVASNQATELLKASVYHLDRGVGNLYSEYPPVILAPGTAHYSIQKAADILGIGRDNIVYVNVDQSYRLDVNDLEKKIGYVLAENKVPLAVIPVLGTTEEGAVDPVHKVIDLRTKFEEQRNVSFWVHVDAAWGGYIRTLFNLSPDDEMQLAVAKVSARFNLKYANLPQWHEDFFASVCTPDNTYRKTSTPTPPSEMGPVVREAAKNRAVGEKGQMQSVASMLNYDEYAKRLRKFANEYKELGIEPCDFDVKLTDRIDQVNSYVSEDLHLEYGRYTSDITIRWGSKDVCSSFVGISQADSITVDPHKMGYLNYPCGMIAFKNDRVRHFIIQKAPYITSVRQDILVHMPPQHIADIDGNPKAAIDAFAPFIVEGSRPGASATALWLTIKTIPPTSREGGSIVKASLLAARELYEWLVHWDKIMSHNQSDTDYTLVPLTLHPPDTNVVIFAVKKKTSNSLAKMNEFTKLVYERFTIQAELGDREYSYSQPFFLSKTTFEEPKYPFESIRHVLDRFFGEHVERLRTEYRRDGIVVLRAAVMNPYIRYSRNTAGQNVLREFMADLSKAATAGVPHI